MNIPYKYCGILTVLLTVTACSGGISPAGLSIGIGGGSHHVGIGTALTIPLGSRSNGGIHVSEQTVASYFAADGQAKNQPVAGGFFRKILSQQSGGLYLVQDFYHDNGQKRTDPMLIEQSQLKNAFAYPQSGSQTLYYPSGNVQTQTQYQQGRAIRSQSWPDR